MVTSCFFIVIVGRDGDDGSWEFGGEMVEDDEDDDASGVVDAGLQPRAPHFSG